MSEAERKRQAALAASGGRLVTSRAPDVRWLLCGRGRPVVAGADDAGYTVVLEEGAAPLVLFADIETSRVEAEERLDELGYELRPYPWHEGAPLEDTPSALDSLRFHLCAEEAARLRSAGADAADALRAVLGRLAPELQELDAAAELTREAHARGFTTPVVLVAGEARQPLHRHPLPTGARLGRHALLVLCIERDGLYVSLTRVVSFGPPPAELERLVRASAEVDAEMIAASQPGTTLGAVLDVAARAYAERGFPDEWRRHHQGGLAGYRGREVLATPGEATRLPPCCAVAWNPSITGGGKSEDTVLVSGDALEVVTRTPDLGELAVGALPRPAIVRL